jgi:hypothetical protein
VASFWYPLERKVLQGQWNVWCEEHLYEKGKARKTLSKGGILGMELYL